MFDVNVIPLRRLSLNQVRHRRAYKRNQRLTKFQMKRRIKPDGLLRNGILIKRITLILHNLGLHRLQRY